MQRDYKNLCNALEQANVIDKRYCHPFWLATKNKMRTLLLGKPNQKILHERCITHTMVRRGIGATQKYEITYLKYCTFKQTKKLLSRFAETDFLKIPRECKEFNCTTNSLGHLFYAAKIFETLEHEKEINTIVEFGGGYGNLARIFKMTLPHATIIIFDLPEAIALQSLFLNSTLESADIIIHTKLPTDFKTGSIHLVPVFFIDNIEIDADVFVSTFGISEAPVFVQQKIAAKAFFNAQTCYLAGQLKGWSGQFEQHNLLFGEIKNNYSWIQCQPFHADIGNLLNYELLAANI